MIANLPDTIRAEDIKTLEPSDSLTIRRYNGELHIYDADGVAVGGYLTEAPGVYKLVTLEEGEL